MDFFISYLVNWRDIEKIKTSLGINEKTMPNTKQRDVAEQQPSRVKPQAKVSGFKHLVATC